MSDPDLIHDRLVGKASRTGLYGIATAALLASTGCTTLGGNVSGDFACRAPGGSCSPMSAIDARAVESVLGSGDASPDRSDNAWPRPFRPQQGSGPVGRTGERTLRIVFPAHVDRAGVLHDEATAHVVVEDAAWTVAPSSKADATIPGASAATPDFQISRSPAPSSLREAVAGASAPAIEGLESLPAQAPHPIVGVDAPLAPRLVLGPTPEALAAARAGHRIARPEVGIKPAGPPAGPPLGAGWSLPRGKVLLPSGSDPQAAAKRVRELAKPGLGKLGKTPVGPAPDDPGDPFGTVKPEGVRR